jgi:hypothetical protein
MLLKEDYDADEILRDGEEEPIIDEGGEKDEDVRELNLGNEHDAKENFGELASDMGDEEDLWE